MIKILVTGGAGYIGTATVDRLKRAGHSIVVADHLQRGFKTAVHEATEFHQVDLSDLAATEIIFKHNKFDLIIHLAAWAYVKESVQYPQKYLTNNVDCTKNILKLAKRYKVSKIIFSSSCTVYGNTTRNLKADEVDSCEPINPYGESKLICEALIKESGLDYIILRYFNVAGADLQRGLGIRTEFASHLIHVLARAAVANETLTINGHDYQTIDGTCVRDYIHVSDIALIHELALKHLLEKSCVAEILNCGYGVGYSVKQIIQQFELANRVKVAIVYSERRQGDPDYLVSNSQRLSEILNWNSLFEDPLTEICRSSYQWEKHLANMSSTKEIKTKI